MPAVASGLFGTVQLPDTNYLLDAASGKTTADVARTQIANQGAQIENQLASNTLGSRTQIAANAADAGGIANQYAPQRNALELSLLKQQTGQESSPAYDLLLKTLNPGGNGQTPAPQSGTQELIPGLASRESGNDPSAVNAGGYSGMFQQGAARLSDPGVGVYTPAKGEDVNANTWNGTFSIPGFPEVKTHADFLASPGAQKAALASEVANTNQAIAATPGADKLSTSGLQAVAHLGGVTGMQKFVATGGAYNPADANGTRLSDYYNQFAQGGPAALQAAFGHPDGPPAGPGMAVAPAPAVPAAAPVQVVGPGAPTVSAPASQPPSDPTAAGPVPQSPAPAPAPQIQNPNGLLATAMPPGTPPPATPTNALAQAAPVQAAAPPAAPPAQPGTGMNSPQVQQAQALLRQATQIEMIAAQAPNDPRVKALAAAKVAELRGQAQVLMQADSVTVDPTTGLQTHTLTGKVDNAAIPIHNPARVTKVDGPNGTILTQPGSPDRVIPYGGRPEQVDAYKRDIPETQDITTAAQTAQNNMPRLNEMADLIHQVKSGGLAPELRAKISSSLQAAGFDPDSVAKLPGLSNGSAAELFKKLSISTAGGEAKANAGSNNGIQSTQLYLSANPGLNLLPDANMRVTNMLRVSSQMTQDYAQAALGHFGKSEAEFLGNNPEQKAGNYVPLTTFNRQWQAQSNPQVGAAAIGILNGDPFDKWSARITPAEGARAAQIVARIDPSAVVPLKGGGTRPISDILGHPSITPPAAN